MDELKIMLLKIIKSKEYIDYNKFHEGNIFSITKTSRLEHMHSNFIAWLLDSHSNHGLSDYAIKQFIAVLYIAKNKESNKFSRRTKEIDKFIPFIQFDSSLSLDSKADREVTFKIGSKKRSIDILIKVVIESKILPIVIENKVDSSEHDDQTNDYFDYSEKEFVDELKYYKPIYIYLTPEYNSSKPKNVNFIILKYQDLLDYVLEPSLIKSSDGRTKNNILSYIRCLSYQSDNEKGGNAMATSKEEREILENFYTKNQNLINSIIEMITDDDDVDPELKEKMSKVTSSRDYSKYAFDGNTYSKNQLVLAVVKKYVSENSSINYDDLTSVFPKSLQGSKGVIKKCDDLAGDEKEKRFFDEEIILDDGTRCVVCNQWGVPNIGRFIDKAKELGYSIEKITC